MPHPICQQRIGDEHEKGRIHADPADHLIGFWSMDGEAMAHKKR